MIETFTHGGVKFQYPANWSLDLEEDDADWTATLQSPGTAVLMLTFRVGEEVAALGDEALESLQADYDDLDSEIAVEQLAGVTALGHDIDILTLDLPVSIRTRAIPLRDGALLILWQYGDFEADHYEGVIRAILASLSIE